MKKFYKKSDLLNYISLSIGIIGCYLSFVSDTKYAILALLLTNIIYVFDNNKSKSNQIIKVVYTINYLLLPICISISLGFYNLFILPLYILFALNSSIKIISKENNQVEIISLLIPILYLLIIMSKPIFLIIYLIMLFLISILYLFNYKIINNNLYKYLFETLLIILILIF